MDYTAPLAYGLSEAARQLGGMHRSTLERHIRHGRIRAVHVGRRVLITRVEIERILGLYEPTGPMAQR